MAEVKSRKGELHLYEKRCFVFVAVQAQLAHRGENEFQHLGYIMQEINSRKIQNVDVK